MGRDSILTAGATLTQGVPRPSRPSSTRPRPTGSRPPTIGGTREHRAEKRTHRGRTYPPFEEQTQMRIARNKPNPAVLASCRTSRIKPNLPPQSNPIRPNQREETNPMRTAPIKPNWLAGTRRSGPNRPGGTRRNEPNWIIKIGEIMAPEMQPDNGDASRGVSWLRGTPNAHRERTERAPGAHRTRTEGRTIGRRRWGRSGSPGGGSGGRR